MSCSVVPTADEIETSHAAPVSVHTTPSRVTVVQVSLEMTLRSEELQLLTIHPSAVAREFDTVVFVCTSGYHVHLVSSVHSAGSEYGVYFANFVFKLVKSVVFVVLGWPSISVEPPS